MIHDVYCMTSCRPIQKNQHRPVCKYLQPTHVYRLHWPTSDGPMPWWFWTVRPYHAMVISVVKVWFSNFEWNVAYWPKEYAAKAGNLTYFKGKRSPHLSAYMRGAYADYQYVEHSFGGHFAGFDNPPALIDDIRHIGDFFERVWLSPTSNSRRVANSHPLWVYGTEHITITLSLQCYLTARIPAGKPGQFRASLFIGVAVIAVFDRATYFLPFEPLEFKRSS